MVVERGLAPSRERAQALILAGRVIVDGRPAGKPGGTVPGDAAIALLAPDHPFVGRGGLKLEGALTRLGVDPHGLVALDVGASTGGFTDCLLKRGARRVYALDVGTGQLDWSLRRDPRVVTMEGRNARHLRPEDLPEPVDLAVVDVSFISLALVLPPLRPLVKTGGTVLALVKPQFEVGRRDVGKGGIVRDPALHRGAVASVARSAAAAGYALLGGCRSPLPGAEGNVEFFLLLGPGPRAGAAGDAEALARSIVDEERGA
ncbi:MAG TPA: TlyA family RNA methyltransferase [Candidatus Polarisedimenticolia bacterium]|nr:TlyA family RNA methyltransferase [Candidatus Polarisedimenticolia bacterium]